MMPEQFPYPQDGWSTGTMRKVGERDYPMLPAEELSAWSQGMAADGKTYGFERHQPWDSRMADPGGALVEQGHPQMKEIENTHDIYNIPNEAQPQSRPGFKWLFVKPKPKEPLTSSKESETKVAKMLPTSGEASRVLETAAGRQKGKRREAEAM